MIRLVTVRYRELQGLRLAIPGAVTSIVFGAWFLGTLPVGSGSIVVLLVCLAHAFIQAYLNQYYKTRFGVVEGRDFFNPLKWTTIVSLAIGIIVSMSGGPLGAIFVAFSVPHLWTIVRDFPQRNYHSIGLAGAGAAAALAWSPNPSWSAVLAITIHGASLIPVGILDHQLLASLRLSEPEASVDTESTAS